MRSPRNILAGWIISTPATDNVDSVRPGDKKTFTIGKEPQPEVTIQLVTAGDEAIPMGEIDLEGDVTEFRVEVKETEDGDFVPVTNADDDEPKV